ncbi:MAG TPA: hypothetical protein VH120_10765, partial [Gemmataceae bacterium]|nr:hypothetical protein [Gemmataceae bacterium]
RPMASRSAIERQWPAPIPIGVSGRFDHTTQGRFITSHFEETSIRRLDSEAHPELSEAEHGESAQNGPDRDHHHVASARLVAAADRP